MTQTSLAASTVLPPCDILLVAAIQEEYDAIQAVETGAVPGSAWREHKDAQGFPVRYRAFLNHERKELRVALIRNTGMGGAATATATAGLMGALRPQCLAMSGVCGGHPEDTDLGDVVIAERVFLHDSGKLKESGLERDINTFGLYETPWLQKAEEFAKDPGDAHKWLNDELAGKNWDEKQQRNWLLNLLSFDINPRKHQALFTECCPEYTRIMKQLWDEGLVVRGSASLAESGKQHLESERFLHLDWPSLDSPRRGFSVRVAPMASGNAIVADGKLWTAFPAFGQRKTLAIEMESEAIGRLATRHKIPFLVMKGVMDHATPKKADNFKHFAARASAECLLAFLRKNLEPRGTDPYPGDSLVPGTTPLPATQPKPSDLLKAGNEIVPFHGRQEFMAELEAWRKESDPVRIRLIHGAGGMGKTRLMIEWTKRVRESGENWMAGFLREPREGWFDRLSSLDQPMLIAIDYAERWPERTGPEANARPQGGAVGAGQSGRPSVRPEARAGDRHRVSRGDRRCLQQPVPGGCHPAAKPAAAARHHQHAGAAGAADRILP